MELNSELAQGQSSPKGTLHQNYIIASIINSLVARILVISASYPLQLPRCLAKQNSNQKLGVSIEHIEQTTIGNSHWVLPLGQALQTLFYLSHIKL
jgi:hypothetical protein